MSLATIITISLITIPTTSTADGVFSNLMAALVSPGTNSNSSSTINIPSSSNSTSNNNIINITTDTPHSDAVPCGKWQYYKELNKCVYYVGDSKNWIDAMTQCSMSGGTLLVVPDKDTFKWLTNTYHPQPTDSAWLGGSDAHDEGKWNWVDPDAPKLLTQMTFFGWNSNNDNAGKTGPEANCLGYVGNFWEDKNCSQKMGFYCEVKNANKCMIDNGGCDQVCTPMKGLTRSCSCLPGFQLHKKYKCKDIDECIIKNGMCQHKCINFGGGRNCSCFTGYQLMSETQCIAEEQCSKNNWGCDQTCVYENGVNKCTCDIGYTAVGKKCIKMAGNLVRIILILIIVISLSSLPVSALVLFKTRERVKKRMLKEQAKNDEDRNKEASDSDTESSSGGNSSASGGAKTPDEEDKKSTSIDNVAE